MAGGIKQLKKNEILFREGDDSDAMYVIKKGRIAITKSKGSGEVTLAELKTGEMLGEMAFFDNNPRSAGAKALTDTEVIVLPFAALHAQFRTFPEWLRAMVKTVNAHLRNANKTIKNLQEADSQDTNMFDPYMITKLIAIISLIGHKSGKPAEGEEEGAIVVPTHTLRNYCIQVFGLPTSKMDKMMDALQGQGFMKVEELGEGRRRITILKHKELSDFVDWYNDYLFKDEKKRITITQEEMPILKAIRFYGRKAEKDDKGMVQINLTDMQNNSMKDLEYVADVNSVDSLIQKGLCEDKQMSGETVSMKFNIDEVERITPYWQLVYNLLSIQI